MINSADIIIYSQRLYVSESFILSRTDYRSDYLLRHRGNKALKSWKWIKHFGVYFYDFETIPNNIRLGHKDDLLLRAVVVEDQRLNAFKTAFEQCCEDYKSFNVDYYRYESEYKQTAERAQELCQAHGVTLAILEWDREKRYQEFELTKTEMWECMREVANKLCPYTFKMKNAISLQNKVKRLPPEHDELRDALINKKNGNQSARKVGREENKIVDTQTGEVFSYDIHQVLFFQYWMNPYKANKLTKSMVYDRYKIECAKQGIDPVSLSTVKSYINKNRQWMSLERDGYDTFNEKYAPYIPQKKLKYSGSLWAADYSGLKLLYNDNGKARSPYMLRIVDVASEKIVGYAFSDGGEDWRAVLEALEMAVENNGGYAAAELITDNGGAFIGHNIKHRLETLFQKHRPITLGNKQANPAEVYVKLLSDFSRRFENWSMLGFNSSFKNIENVANPDYIKLKELPTKPEVHDQGHGLVEMWNNEPRPSGHKPNEYHEANRLPSLPKVSARTHRFVFGTHTQIAFGTARSIISVRYRKQDYKFNVEDWDATLSLIATNSTDKNMTVTLVYNSEAADIYSLDGKYLTTLEPVKYSHKGFAEKTDETAEAYKAHRSKKKQYKTDAEAQINELIQASEAIEMPYMMTAKLNGNAKQNSQKLESDRIANDSDNQEFDIDEFQYSNL